MLFLPRKTVEAWEPSKKKKDLSEFDVRVTVHRDKFDVQVTVHHDKFDVQVTVHRDKFL